MAMLFPDAPADVPEGFAYHADVMTEVEERALLDGLKALAFGAVRMRGQVARRRTDARGDAGAALGLRARRRRALAVAARDPSGTRGALLGHLQDAPGWRRPGVI